MAPRPKYLNHRERILAHVDMAPGGCWYWTASLDSNGYGQVGGGSRAVGKKLAHRVSYEAFVGPIADGLTLDHLCRVRCCVNPSHLEPVPMGVNVRRGYGPSAVNARKSTCIRGHAFSPENTWTSPSTGARMCRACRGLAPRLPNEGVLP